MSPIEALGWVVGLLALFAFAAGIVRLIPEDLDEHEKNKRRKEEPIPRAQLTRKGRRK